MSKLFNDNCGNILDMNLPLAEFGAPGFELIERLDFSGHRNGLVTPHVNSEIITDSGNMVYKDLLNTQLPGFNGMQVSNE